MCEPQFPFYSEGSEEDREHCHWCGLPLPEDGDSAVIRVTLPGDYGRAEKVPVCRRHWRDSALCEREAGDGAFAD